MKKSKIPEFKTIKEEAAFWDTHDVTDYLEEMDLVSGAYLPQVDERKTVMTIRIAPSLKEKVEHVARSYDISTSSLVRMWIVDRLRSLEK
jgi:hypothetical protein